MGGAGPGVGAGGEDGSEQDLVPHMELGADVAAELEVGDEVIRRSVPSEYNLLAGGVVTASELDGIGLGARDGERRGRVSKMARPGRNFAGMRLRYCRRTSRTDAVLRAGMGLDACFQFLTVLGARWPTPVL